MFDLAMGVVDNFENQMKEKFQETLQFLMRFFRHPIQEIKSLPSWPYRHLLVVHLFFSITSGFLAGLVTLNYLHVLFGIFFLPVISLTMSFVLTSFFFYYFQVFEKRLVSFRQLFTLVLFANFPFFIFQIGANLLPPLTILGFAFTGFLLAVGLSENFQMEKKRALRLILILFAVIFLVWLWNQIDIQRMDRI